MWMWWCMTREIIKKRDEMSLSSLREITNKTMEKYGFVDYKRLFETMGYIHRYNDKYEFVKIN